MPTKKPAPPPEKKVLKIFVNTDPDTIVEIHEWKLTGGKNGDDTDHPRVDVQTEHLCYSTILDDLEPKVETWEVDSKGQLVEKPISTILLPFMKGLVEFEVEPD